MSHKRDRSGHRHNGHDFPRREGNTHPKNRHEMNESAEDDEHKRHRLLNSSGGQLDFFFKGQSSKHGV